MFGFAALRAFGALAALLACGAATAAGSAPPPTPVQQTPYWRERASFFQAFAADAQVAMVGDSLTDGAEWAEMFPGVRIVNRGIDGDTTRGVLARIDGILAAHPARVFVMLGINDFADEHRPVDAVLHDYARLLARLRAGGAQVVVQSTLPCHPAKGAWKSCDALMPSLRVLNARLPALAAREGARFVDLQALAAPDGTLRADLTFDGVHLNGRGYRLWQGAIAPLMP